MQQCERAMFDLRRGVAIIILAGDGKDARGEHRIVFPIETGTPPSLATLQTEAMAAPSLVISPQRLRMLGIADASDCARLPLDSGDSLDMDVCRQIAFGSPTVDAHQRLPFEQPCDADRAAVALLKRALLIPAALTAPIDKRTIDRLVEDRTALDVSVDEVDACVEASAGQLSRISEADVPLEVATKTRFILFREPDGLREHMALQIGHPEEWPEAVPVRLHSACLTGDLFGSLRCDCGEQLRGGVARIAAAGGGVLLYLAQEGRGIGLANKLRAYTLQDAGADTIDADGTLGFAPDERRYRVAVAMLEQLGVERIRLLTNNPQKLAAIEAGGIEVVDREAVYGQLNEHNKRYLQAKADRSGHLLDEWLGAESEADQ